MAVRLGPMREMPVMNQTVGMAAPRMPAARIHGQSCGLRERCGEAADIAHHGQDQCAHDCAGRYQPGRHVGRLHRREATPGDEDEGRLAEGGEQGESDAQRVHRQTHAATDHRREQHQGQAAKRQRQGGQLASIQPLAVERHCGKRDHCRERVEGDQHDGDGHALEGGKDRHVQQRGHGYADGQRNSPTAGQPIEVGQRPNPALMPAKQDEAGEGEQRQQPDDGTPDDERQRVDAQLAGHPRQVAERPEEGRGGNDRDAA